MSKLGCVRDRFDERDYLMRAYLAPVKLPRKVDYTRKLSPVRNQGDEGTCVGFATACGMKEYQEMLDYEKLVLLSPRFVYAECKKIDGMPGIEGTSIRTAMKVLNEKGVCQEKLWPYSPQQKTKAKKGAPANAKKFRVKSYARILNLDELRSHLYTKGPCAIGVEVFHGFFETKTGVVAMPKKDERSLGGHAISPVGYDDTKRLIKFKNS
ncbi:MAG: C1 family peptidase [Candidatus Omnitrophica bacterium]|nr:C1 family peptidase [Candidatus Omnitrophota bacterium]